MTYDYIIIGAGTAGCVLAYRLSENPANSVLLLEAGGKDNRIEVSMPVGYPKLQKTKRDWQYHTVPQKGMYNRILYQPRGKMIGGTGSMNGMIYIRGNKSDYDKWASNGNEGWSYEEVLPFFKMSEKNGRFSNEFHNQDGLLAVNDNQFSQPLNAAFVEAAMAENMPFNDDFNGVSQEGVGYFQANIENGKRCSTARSFLYPAKHRPNLKIIAYTNVEKIDIEGKRATGIATNSSGIKRFFTCRKEVIICAGAVNSPKLLLQSGLGPATELEALNIPVKSDRPGVGKNLQDHIQFFLGYRCTQPISLNSSLTLNNLIQYFFKKEGMLASAICSAGGFIKSAPGLDRPDLQIHFIPGIAGPDINNMKAQPKYDGYMLGLTLLRPKSRGYVKLNASNPSGKPLIDPCFFSDVSDVKALMKGFQIGNRILDQHAFAPFRGQLEKPEKVLQNTDEIEAFIRKTTESVYHSAGTCKMGNDQESVVDQKLLIHGFENIRVADASIFPTIISGNVNAAVIMVAEKAANFILTR